MEAPNVTTHYEQLRNERIARNRMEVALRLREAGFEDFSSSLFSTSRAGSSIKSSAAPALKKGRGRRQSKELSSVPRQSTRQRLAPEARLTEAPKPPMSANTLQFQNRKQSEGLFEEWHQRASNNSFRQNCSSVRALQAALSGEGVNRLHMEE